MSTDELPHHMLVALADARVDGPRTPAHAVMARGRSIRRRRRAGGGAVLTAAAVGAGALALPGSPFALGRPAPRTAVPAAGTEPAPAPTAVVEECAAGGVQPPTPDTRPADVPALLHVVDPDEADDPVAEGYADTFRNQCGRPARYSGADVDDAGVVTRSWSLEGPLTEAQLNAPGGGVGRTVRGRDAVVNEYLDAGVWVTWRENGALWSFEGHGMTASETIGAVEDLHLDGTRVDTGSLRPANRRVDLAATTDDGHAWTLSYLSANQDAGGWSLSVEDGYGSFNLPPVAAARPGDRFVDVGGVEVLSSSNVLGRAIWRDAGGRLFTLSGSISQERALDLVPHVRHVPAGDPTLVDAVARHDAALAEAERENPPAEGGITERVPRPTWSAPPDGDPAPEPTAGVPQP